jgi:hypothetical protein
MSMIIQMEDLINLFLFGLVVWLGGVVFLTLGVLVFSRIPYWIAPLED